MKNKPTFKRVCAYIIDLVLVSFISSLFASIEFINQLNDFFVSKGLHPVTYKTKNYYDISLGRREEIQILYANIYKESSYFLHRKYEKFW